MQRVVPFLLLVTWVAAAAPAVAQDPVEADWHRLEVLRRVDRYPDDDASAWPADFAGLELHSFTDDLQRADGAPARHALNRLAVSGDFRQFGADLRAHSDQQCTLALAGLGDALVHRYDGDNLEHNVGFGTSLEAARSWLRGTAGPAAGTCGAIHDTLRRAAVSAGHREAVTVNISGDDDYGHVIAAWRSAGGWTALDYNRWLDSNTTSFGEFLEMATAARGRTGGEAQVFRDQYLYTHETRVGRLASRFFDRSELADLGGSLFGDARTSGAGGIRARIEPGSMALDGDGSIPGTSGRVTAGFAWIDDTHPLGGIGTQWTADRSGWHANTRWQVGAIGGLGAGREHGAALLVSEGVAGLRVSMPGGRLAIGLVYDLFHDIGALGRLALGQGSNPFRSLAEAGVIAGWSLHGWDTVTFSVQTRALAEAGLTGVRRQVPGLFAARWRTELAAETHGLRAFGSWTWRRTGASLELGATARIGGVCGIEITARVRRTQARRPELEPSSAAVEGSIAWRPGPFALICTGGWTTETGAHGAGGALTVRAELTYRW